MQENVTSIDEVSKSRLGWLDAMMMSGSLRMIDETDLSLSWQRDIAGEKLRLFMEHLPIACPIERDERWTKDAMAFQPSPLDVQA